MLTSTQPNELPEPVYELLRGLASQLMLREDVDHTLQPTALVHEAYLRIAQQESSREATREQLVSLAALMIRRVLIDHHRARSALKRGGASARFFGDIRAQTESPPVLSVEEALQKLERLDPAKAQIVTLKFYAGLSLEQIADVTDQSTRTVARQWAFARAWLSKELGDDRS